MEDAFPFGKGLDDTVFVDPGHRHDGSDIDVPMVILADRADRVTGQSVIGVIGKNFPGLRIIAEQAAVIGADPKTSSGITEKTHGISDAIVDLRRDETHTVISVKTGVCTDPDISIPGLCDSICFTCDQSVICGVGYGIEIRFVVKIFFLMCGSILIVCTDHASVCRVKTSRHENGQNDGHAFGQGLTVLFRVSDLKDIVERKCQKQRQKTVREIDKRDGHVCANIFGTDGL